MSWQQFSKLHGPHLRAVWDRSFGSADVALCADVGARLGLAGASAIATHPRCLAYARLDSPSDSQYDSQRANQSMLSSWKPETTLLLYTSPDTQLYSNGISPIL